MDKWVGSIWKRCDGKRIARVMEIADEYDDYDCIGECFEVVIYKMRTIDGREFEVHGLELFYNWECVHLSTGRLINDGD